MKALVLRVLVSAVLLLSAAVASAQPFRSWLTNVSGHGYIQLPSSASLNFSGGSFTFEAWVAVQGSGCTSLAGNSFTTAQWIGICGNELRSYISGSSSQYTIGSVPANDWTHVAVTYDAVTKLHSHYVDGELVGQRTWEAGVTASPAAWRIFSDISYEFTPVGAIDEVRFWNVARTRDQIRSRINRLITAAQPGLVAVYSLDATANDVVGSLHGTKNGSANYLNGAITTGCTTSTNTLCVGPSGRFALSATWKTASASGVAKVVPYQTSDSGLFTFFSDSNWEMTVKVLNGCPVNTRWWVFASGLTDQHVELVVTDQQHGETIRYFNYFGQPFNLNSDVDAFATCP
ncbi:MAG TPA: LamG domain-containing protein [Thermoanaerobaculia bacterium]